MSVVATLAAMAGAFTSVYKAFARFDIDQSPSNRVFVKDSVLGLRVDNQKWRQFFTELFARFFGDRHLSFKCMKRSFFLSTIIFAIIVTSWYLPALPRSRALFGTYRTIGLFATSCIADYLSLWKTRLLLTNFVVRPIVVIGDALASIAVYAIMFITAEKLMFRLAYIWDPYSDLPESYRWGPTIPEMLYFVAGIFFHSDMPGVNFARALFLAVLYTSAWLWIYLVVAYSIRAVNLVPGQLKLLSKFMDFENHPVRTIGYVAATMSAMVVGVFTVL
jgi:hypothetical protein